MVRAVSLVLMLFVSAASGDTFLVTNINDSGPGSLRQAILDANARPGMDEIRTSGLNTQIRPLSALPPIEDAATVKGVGINGSDAGSADGLTISATGVRLLSLHVTHFSGHGIVLRNAHGTTIQQSKIGTFYLPNAGNGGFGIVVEGGSGNTIGGNRWRNDYIPDDGNEIRANHSGEILLLHTSRTSIYGNNLGIGFWDRVSTTPLGIVVNGGTGHRIYDNNITGTTSAAIQVLSGRAEIFKNHGSRNSGLPIDLAGDGPTANDPLDSDEGPNHLQNYPELTVVGNGQGFNFAGTLKSEPSRRFRIDLYRWAGSCDGLAESGPVHVAEREIETDANGEVAFDGLTLWSFVVSEKTFISATATLVESGGTSEHSPCVPLQPTGVFQADLEVRHVEGTYSAVSGSDIFVTSEVINRGPVDALYVNIYGSPDPGAHVVSIELLGREGRCFEFDRCEAGTLKPGEVARIRQKLHITAPAGSTAGHSVQAIQTSSQPDPDSSNNVEEVSIAVTSGTPVQDVDLDVRLEFYPSSTSGRDNDIEIVARVVNRGSTTATNVRVVLAVTGANGSVGNNSGPYWCERAGLNECRMRFLSPGGAAYGATGVMLNAGDSISATVEVTADQTDRDLSNNRAAGSATSPIPRQPLGPPAPAPVPVSPAVLAILALSLAGIGLFGVRS